MTNQEKASVSRKITLGLIIGWALGIFLVVPAISLLFTQPATGIALLAASLILLPPAINFIQQKGNFHLSRGVKVVLVVVLLGVATATMDKSQLPKSNTSGGNVPAPVEAQEQAAPKSYQETFVFKGNGVKKSEPFTIEGDKFKIAYNCTGSFCSAWLKRPGNDLPVELIMNGQGPLQDESIIYKSGTYYIDVNSIGSYTMSVQDYR